MTDPLMIYVDHREEASGIIEKIAERGIKIKVMQLPVGDYLISERLVVERKTGEDFLNSIADGRLFSQAENTIDHFDKSVMIIEGEVFGIRNFHENAIRGAMLSLMIDYGIPIIQTRNMDETAAYIAQLAKREQKDDNRPLKLRGDKRKMTVAQKQQFVLESFPGIGPNIAKSMLKRFKTLDNVFKANERELREVEKIGKKKAKEFWKLLVVKYED